jgi:hypothetical protein
MLANPGATRFVPDLLDGGNAFRATIDLPSSHRVVVLLRYVETISRAGRITTTYRTRVTSAGVPVLDAMMDCPVPTDVSCALGVNRYLAPTSFALRAAIAEVSTPADGTVSAAGVARACVLGRAVAAVPRTFGATTGARGVRA